MRDYSIVVRQLIIKFDYIYDTSQEILPEAVCRADRNTGEVLAKYCDSYLYCDIL